MKNLAVALFCVLIFLIAACENEDLSLERVPQDGMMGNNPDVFEINSIQSMGFSAGELKLADFPETDADFIIIPQTNAAGEVMLPFLSDPNLEKRFLLAGEFENSIIAGAFYSSYDLRPAVESLQLFALNLKPNQIWLVRARSADFCKILILETQVDKSTSFVKIRFKAAKI